MATRVMPLTYPLLLACSEKFSSTIKGRYNFPLSPQQQNNRIHYLPSYPRMPSFMHIVRLSEDYIPEPSASSQGPLYKQNLLLQTSAKNEWVLVRVLFESSSTPIWIPKRLVTKAKPGFYRLRADYEWNSGASKKKGDIIKVSYVNEGE